MLTSLSRQIEWSKSEKDKSSQIWKPMQQNSYFNRLIGRESAVWHHIKATPTGKQGIWAPFNTTIYNYIQLYTTTYNYIQLSFNYSIHFLIVRIGRDIDISPPHQVNKAYQLPLIQLYTTIYNYIQLSFNYKIHFLIVRIRRDIDISQTLVD